ncbi:Katanin p60 ATPase-containing subunit A-like 2 [Hypsibius exemplaris]|uniref:Katanin p60 ATPase-containing subunit A-like 2 n=1 Tax=Hypsibius exemplaris TaxID=2072580 RepID=A0A1W0WD93_HYPEX|nr:Katanin p60 ATPase-containing subunit A-like 2 [Hypsibius exemplaris]
MSTLSYSSLKSASNLRDHDDRQRNTRHRNILVLILEYLKESALLESADALVRETKSAHHQDISALKVCDNMDLSTILLEYECSYLARLQKKPRFIREILPEEKAKATTSSAREAAQVGRVGDDLSQSDGDADRELLQRSPHQDHGDTQSRSDGPPLTRLSLIGRMKAALETYRCHNGDEMYELAVTISREMFLDDPNVHWDDIKGMEDAKRLVKEAVVYPVKYPDLFQGILAPWRGLLLTGPPGTGKTMLAKAVATECKTAFFNITASTVVSKWRGESEKLIRVLFDLARKCAPTCIFLDELDSLMGQRGEHNEHEGSRRMKTEILIQMDGLARCNDVVFVLAASNLPWELDTAMVRRLEKRVFVDLPGVEARQAMFAAFLPAVLEHHPLGMTTQLDYIELARLTMGYSGSDIYGICKETAMRALRKILAVLDDESGATGYSCLDQTVSVDPIVTADVVKVLHYTKPVETERGLAKYKEWKQQFEAS